MKKATIPEEKRSRSHGKNTTLNTSCKIAKHQYQGYSSVVAANSATGFGHSIKLAHRRRSNPKAGAFFLPDISIYGGCVREGFGPAGCQLSRLTNLHTAATHSFGHERGSSKPKVGATPMKTIRTIRASAHRRMALAALRADTSLRTRLTRYQQHMTKARALENVGGVK